MYTTLVFFLIVIIIFMVGINHNSNFFFNKNYTTSIKGICALIVIMVHIPEQYTNTIQDGIGSFAYVAVTIFFAISAYGLEYSVDHNNNYLNNFWRNRLTSLFAPVVSLNILGFIALSCVNKTTMWKYLFEVNDYIICLIEYYALFYLLKLLSKKYSISTNIIDALLIACVVVISIFSYFMDIYDTSLFGWCFERFGLIWGLLLYRLKNKFLTFANNKTIMKISILFIISLLLGVAYLKFKPIWFYGEYLLKIVLGVSLFSLMILSTCHISFGNTITKWLGNISYEIYLTHLTVIVFLEKVFPYFNSELFILSTLICTLIISIVIHALSMMITKKIRRL